MAGIGYLPSLIEEHSQKWVLVSAIGWLLWFGVLATCILDTLYIAAAYLTVLLLTSIVIRSSHRHQTRRLVSSTSSQQLRLVVVYDGMDDKNWTRSIGSSSVIGSLLINPTTSLALLGTQYSSDVCSRR